MVEVLKQPPYQPLAVERQVVIIFAGTKGYLDDIDAGSVTKFEAELYPFMEAKYSSIFDSIRESKKIDSDTEADLKRALDDFKSSFVG